MTDLVRFSRLLRHIRESCDGNEVPGLVVGSHPRGKRGITQEQLGRLTGISDSWYRAFESGRHAPSPEWIETLVRALVLDEGQRHSLHVYATGAEPPSRYLPDRSKLHPTEEALVQMQPWSAYVSNFAWDVMTLNATAGREWPWMLNGINVMIWALAYPEARMQLVNWEEDWAKPMASQLRLRHEANPDHARLNEVIAEIKQRDRGAARLLEDDLTTVHHPDRERRLAYLPGHGDTVFDVTFLCYTPMSDPSLRLMVVPAEAR
ncbi:helix-turn-helix domain-containing protein [Streptomyces sp. NPDC051597]|uniref:helix-turn-helix domain-containing protein n=1 Tax=Streptomyces sp. NPDC051597 TaxID=3155049 RepID=UPI003446275F